MDTRSILWWGLFAVGWSAALGMAVYLIVTQGVSAVKRLQHRVVPNCRTVTVARHVTPLGEGKVTNITYSYEPDVTSSSVIWIQPIFLPTSAYLPGAKRVLEGLVNYFEHWGKVLPNFDIQFRFAGWALNDSLWDQYLTWWHEAQTKIGTNRFTQSEPLRIPHNYGQAYIYHHFYLELQDNPPEFVITNGSDLCLEPFSPPLIHNGILTMKALGTDHTGLLAFSMSPHNVHRHTLGDSDMHMVTLCPQQVEPYTTFCSFITTSKTHGGVAGATAILNWNAWKDVGGYKVRGVFSPEDGEMVRSLNQAGWHLHICENLYVVHEFGVTVTSEKFMDWKMRSLQFASQQKQDFIGEDALLPWALESEAIFQELEDELVATSSSASESSLESAKPN